MVPSIEYSGTRHWKTEGESSYNHSYAESFFPSAPHSPSPLSMHPALYPWEAGYMDVISELPCSLAPVDYLFPQLPPCGIVY